MHIIQLVGADEFGHAYVMLMIHAKSPVVIVCCLKNIVDAVSRVL